MTEPMAAWTDAQGASRATALFRAAFGAAPDGVWASPGRVNLIGEHVDYNGGLCLPMALPHRTFAAVRRRDDQVVRLVSALAPEDVWTGTLEGSRPGSSARWVAYAGGPAWSLAQDGHTLGGFDAAIDSCVPLGAGLSSSAAIECAVALALDELLGLGLAAAGDTGRAQLAAACVRAENEVAGAPTGGMDQAASLRATRRARRCCWTPSTTASPRCRFHLAEAGLELLVIDTRARHALVDGQYAARRAACQQRGRAARGGHLREVTDLDAALAALPDPVERMRVRHVVTEIDRVRQFVDLVGDDRVREVGPLMDASHESLRVDYEVSCDELDVAVGAARSAGALGARMTGGGFGGSAIALIGADAATEVSRAVTDAFHDRGWREPGFLIAVAGPAGGRVQ